LRSAALGAAGRRIEPADHSLALITDKPHATRDEFLHKVDDLIEELEGVRHRPSS
jgi:hypothetical protein